MIDLWPGNAGTKQPNLVTVAVDKIQQARGELKADCDYVLFGQIAYTGSSSMDILMKVFRTRDLSGNEADDDKGKCEVGMPEVLDGDDSGAILTSVYTFVARDGRGVTAVCMSIFVLGDCTAHMLFTCYSACPNLRRVSRGD